MASGSIHHENNYESKYITKLVTIKANDNTDIDLSEFIPTGKSLIGVSALMLGNSTLPYSTGNSAQMSTFMTDINSAMIRIKNNVTAWTNYRLSAVIYYK